MFGTPGVNLHAPGPIGDAAPSTLAGTTLTLNSAGTQYTILNGTTTFTIVADINNGIVTYNASGGVNLHVFQVGGASQMVIAGNQVLLQSGVALRIGNAATSAGIAGTLAASTDHYITIMDINNVLQKVPCIAA